MELPQTPSFRLDNKKALVTGASRGIGFAASAALADAGAEVVMAARTQGDLDAAVATITGNGGRARALVLDVGNLENAKSAIREHGPFDILVNNAGVARHGPMTETRVDDFDLVIDVNVRAAYFIAQAVANGMIDAGRAGSIINVSSQMGHVGGPKRAVYCASKFAVEGMTRAMAIELGQSGIRVNTICPTFIETEFTKKSLDDPEFRDWVLSKIKLGRVGKVEDIMGPVVSWPATRHR